MKITSIGRMTESDLEILNRGIVKLIGAILWLDSVIPPEMHERLVKLQAEINEFCEELIR